MCLLYILEFSLTLISLFFRYFFSLFSLTLMSAAEQSLLPVHLATFSATLSFPLPPTVQCSSALHPHLLSPFIPNSVD